MEPVIWWLKFVLDEIATSVIGFYHGHWAERTNFYPRMILVIVVSTIVELPIGHRDLGQQDKGHAKADARAAFHRALKLLTLVFFLSLFYSLLSYHLLFLRFFILLVLTIL